MVAGLVEQLKSEFPDLRLTEIEITQHPEVAVKYGVMSTPAVAIKGKLEFVGIPREDELKKRIAQHRGLQ